MANEDRSRPLSLEQLTRELRRRRDRQRLLARLAHLNAAAPDSWPRAARDKAQQG